MCFRNHGEILPETVQMFLMLFSKASDKQGLDYIKVQWMKAKWNTMFLHSAAPLSVSLKAEDE